jgi:hypothetical protein
MDEAVVTQEDADVRNSRPKVVKETTLPGRNFCGSTSALARLIA